MAVGDTIFFFFCKTGNSEPGIYGWGKVTNFISGSTSNRQVSFLVKPPTNRVKTNPRWNCEVDELVKSIQGTLPQATLFWVNRRGPTISAGYSSIRRSIN